jgi:pimeloyl-ACP methyl ester carboxylesterase
MSPKLFIHDIGSGLPVLFIHGYPLDHTIWKDQFALSDRYRILAPDLPGFGKSHASKNLSMSDYADTAARLMDEKNIDKAVLIGHSMGGYISLAFAEHHGPRLLGLGLVCSQAGADSEEGKAGRFKNADRVEKEGFGFIVESMIEKLLSPSNYTNQLQLVSELRSIMQGSTSEGVITALEAMAGRKDQFDTLKKLDVPIFITAGNDDVLIPAERSFQMSEACKHPHFNSFAGCGHMAMMENSQEFNTALGRFLNLISY